MKIGILSDTHNHTGNLRRALALFREAGVTQLIHCGDLTSPQTAVPLQPFSLIYTPGNMDGRALPPAIKQLDPQNIVGDIFTGTIDGVAMAATHGHRESKLNALIHNGRYAYVFHGHTHRRRDTIIGQTRVINPGALGGSRHEPRSVAILDLDKAAVTFHELE